MPKIVEIDGEDVTVFTQEEIDAKAAEVAAAKEAEKAELQKKMEADAAHYKTKIDEFANGKKGFDEKLTEKEKEWNDKLEATKQTAEETRSALENEKKARLDVVKNVMFEGYVGEDAEGKKKLQEEYDLLNMPASTEDEIKARAIKAARNAGLSNGTSAPNYSAPFSGGHAPSFSRNEGLKETEHNQFLKEVGLG